MSGHLLLTRALPTLAPQQVFELLTRAEGLARWWWPHIADTSYQTDPQPGGQYEIRSQAAGIGVRGRYLEVSAPSWLRFTWVWLNDGQPQPEEQIEIRLGPGPSGTQLALTHYCSASKLAELQQGWQDVLGRLAALS